MSVFTPKLDPSIRPQDDFFTYVNGEWLKSNPIPESETRWGTFNVLRENSWLAMKAIFENLQNEQPLPGSIEQQARDFYYTGMHFDKLKENHLRTLHDFLGEIDAMKNQRDISHMIGKLHSLDISGPWYCYVGADHDDNTKHVLHFYQSGLTLPNRDYYLDASDKMKKIRNAYEKHLHAVYALVPELASTAKELSDTLIEFETALATISRTPADLRDIESNYHKTPYQKVVSTYKNIHWETYAEAFGWEAGDHITIDQPEFMEYINAALAERSLDEWKIYLKWRITSRLFPRISDRFAQLHFNFFGKVLSGTTEIMPLWKRVALAAESIGEATGQLYTKKHFPEDSKKQVLKLVEEVRSAYVQRIEQLDWMSQKTKKYALKKLANIKVLIGYPDTWRDFSTLTIGRDSYVDNILAAQAFEVEYWFDKLHQPTSREDWFMTPQTVNAYHDPTRQVICFPAAILQSPFFDPKASPAENLGGIGTVIGHELTHGFDDQGCQFDAIGNVRTWQTKAERRAFAKKSQLIVDHADSFEVLPELYLRGKLVLGESIADLGGIELSLSALRKQNPSKQDIKRFFITYAVTECAKVRDEKLREYTLSDEHPVSEFRVNGILQHIDDFYNAFELTPGDALYRPEKDRARIW